MSKISTKEDGRPGFIWYPKDWLGAADIGMCSYAARGLWMELLNLMFLSPKTGYLLLPNNNKPDNKTITKLCRGESVEETEKLLSELKQNGVCSTTEDGCIYCRVMADRAKRNEEIKTMRAEAGRMGMSLRWHNKRITKRYQKDNRVLSPTRMRAETATATVTVTVKENEKEIIEIINYLNLKTGKQYKYTTPKTIDFIRLRMKEGFSVANFKTVIDNQVKEWGNDHKMAQYLRPETLFGTKFESYLNAKIIKNPEDGEY